MSNIDLFNQIKQGDIFTISFPNEVGDGLFGVAGLAEFPTTAKNKFNSFEFIDTVKNNETVVVLEVEEPRPEHPLNVRVMVLGCVPPRIGWIMLLAGEFRSNWIRK